MASLLIRSIWCQFKETTSDGCKILNLHIVNVTLLGYASWQITLLTCALSHVRGCIQMWTLQMGKVFQTHWLCPVLQSHMHTCPDRHLPLWRDLQVIMSSAAYSAHTVTQLHVFKRIKLLPLMSQYILSLLIFVVNDRDQFLIIS